MKKHKGWILLCLLLCSAVSLTIAFIYPYAISHWSLWQMKKSGIDIKARTDDSYGIGKPHSPPKLTQKIISLWIRKEKVNPDLFNNRIKYFPNLQSIYCINCDINLCIRNTSSLYNILTFDVVNCNIISLSSLNNFKQLHSIDIRSSFFKKTGIFRDIKDLKLKSLTLSQSNITDNDLIDIAQMDIGYLTLKNVPITDKGIKILQENNHIYILKLHNVHISSKGIKSISSMQGLEFLYLINMKTPRLSLKSLRKLIYLKKLHLEGENITDQVVIELFQPALNGGAPFQYLSEVVIGKSLVTSKGIKFIQKAGFKVTLYYTYNAQ